VFDVRTTHRQLADAVCAGRPTVSKAVRELPPMGVVDCSGAGIERRIRFCAGLAREAMAR